jgi:hypothetical protein
LAFHLGREADHSPPSSAEVKEWVELYLHYRNTPSWRGAQLGGAQGQLYLLPLPSLYFRAKLSTSLTNIFVSLEHLTHEESCPGRECNRVPAEY